MTQAQFSGNSGFATPIKKPEPDFAWLLNDPLYQAINGLIMDLEKRHAKVD